MIATLVRFLIYGYIVYQVYFVNIWIAIGLSICFLLLELGFFLLQYLKKMVDNMGLVQAQTTNTDFSFITQPLTNEEADLVDSVRGGDYKASATFLKIRCKNTHINFNFLPESVQLMLAQRLINAINRGESPTWSELLSGTKNENQTI